jgi:hypothetical protein
VSGSKADLVAKLCVDTNASKYSFEPKRFNYKSISMYNGGYDSEPEEIGEVGVSGTSTDEIKELARTKGLAVSGKRYDLVLRLLQLDNGVGTPKRAAGEMSESGVFEPKKRAKSMKLPTNTDVFRERVLMKIDVDTSKWSNQKYKDHADNVLNTIVKIIEGSFLISFTCGCFISLIICLLLLSRSQ